MNKKMERMSVNKLDLEELNLLKEDFEEIVLNKGQKVFKIKGKEKKESEGKIMSLFNVLLL